MKAIVYHTYGSSEVLHLEEVEKPAPRDNEVVIQVYAVSVNAGDLHLLSGKPLPFRLMGIGFFRPKNTILGAAIAGRIEAVGGNVKQFQPGDDVFGDLSESGWGGFAEYVCIRADALVRKPASVSFEHAATIPLTSVTALQGLRDRGRIQARQKVLIHGASGGVGTFAVQIAKAFGAEVTAVCSTRNVNTARSMGADHVIDYTKEDFAQNGQYYDLILAINGNRSILEYKRALSPNGTYVMIGGTAKQIFQAMLLGPWIFRNGTRKMAKNVMARPDIKDLAFVKELLEKGLVTPVIDRCYPLSEGAEAVRYLDEEHAKGKVVITMPVADRQKAQ